MTDPAQPATNWPKNPYAGTFWDENGERAWFPVERWTEAEALCAFIKHEEEQGCDTAGPYQSYGLMSMTPVANLADPNEPSIRRVTRDDDLIDMEITEYWEVGV